MNSRLWVLLSALAISTGVAQEFVVEPKKPLTLKRIHFVLDVSGSLAPNISRVFDAVRTLAAPGSDELSIKVTVFSDTPATWGLGWVDMPGPQDMEQAQKTIDSLPHRATRVLPAIVPAAQEPQTPKGSEKPLGPITIVLVTDGLFVEESGERILQAVKDSKHPVLVFGVGNQNEDFLKALGECGGGYVR